MSTEERELLEEIRNQNSQILARLARLESTSLLGHDDGAIPVNISEMLRADDPVAYLRERNAKIKASGRLRKRK